MNWFPGYKSIFPNEKEELVFPTQYDACGENYSFRVTVDGKRFGFMGGEIYPNKIEFSFDPYIHGDSLLKYLAKSDKEYFEVIVRDLSLNINVFNRSCTYEGQVSSSYGSCSSTSTITVCFKRRQINL